MKFSLKILIGILSMKPLSNDLDKNSRWPFVVKKK